MKIENELNDMMDEIDYAGDIFIPDREWKDVTDEDKNDIHSRFPSAVSGKENLLFELFTENLILISEFGGKSICFYKLNDITYLFKSCKISRHLVYVKTFDVIVYEKNKISDKELNNFLFSKETEKIIRAIRDYL